MHYNCFSMFPPFSSKRVLDGWLSNSSHAIPVLLNILQPVADSEHSVKSAEAYNGSNVKGLQMFLPPSQTQLHDTA